MGGGAPGGTRCRYLPWIVCWPLCSLIGRAVPLRGAITFDFIATMPDTGREYETQLSGASFTCCVTGGSGEKGWWAVVSQSDHLSFVLHWRAIGFVATPDIRHNLTALIFRCTGHRQRCSLMNFYTQIYLLLVQHGAPEHTHKYGRTRARTCTCSSLLDHMSVRH